jgi:predicted secreted hydrolase
MDHEFSSSFLEQNQQGWDWFSMQFDDGHSLMLYQMRGRDGTKDPQSSGTWMMPDGTSRILAAEDFTLQPMNVWTSASTSARYPVRWRVHVPSLELAVVVQAVVNQQEMDTHRSTGIVYWEGCVDIEGIRQGRPAPGRGYLEMTGYDDGQPAVRGERR